MGDDCFDHEIKIEINERMTLGDLVQKLVEEKYLALISGGRATWVLMHNACPLAVIAQEWLKPKFLTNETMTIYDLVKKDNRPTFFFQYLAQNDPNMEFDRLSLSEMSPGFLQEIWRNMFK